MFALNQKFISNYLKPNIQKEILGYVNSLYSIATLHNPHIQKVFSKLNGASYMFDISNTEASRYVSTYQSDNNVFSDLPQFLTGMSQQIATDLNIPHQNCFLQILDMNSGGSITPHYDSAYPGHITYKCNLSVLSETYNFCIDGNEYLINEGDLYAFEASLYKHWTKAPFTSRRVLLSYGFVLPYLALGWNENDPRIRLGKRIEKYFQNN